MLTIVCHRLTKQHHLLWCKTEGSTHLQATIGLLDVQMPHQGLSDSTVSVAWRAMNGLISTITVNWTVAGHSEKSRASNQPTVL